MAVSAVFERTALDLRALSNHRVMLTIINVRFTNSLLMNRPEILLDVKALFLAFPDDLLNYDTNQRMDIFESLSSNTSTSTITESEPSLTPSITDSFVSDQTVVADRSTSDYNIFTTCGTFTKVALILKMISCYLF
jgi:hypothetical protein